MQVAKPKQRVYVTLTDAGTNKSKHVTVYDATPEQVLAALKAAANTEKPSRRRAS